MANTWEFEMDFLQRAIKFSFKRRGTRLPEDIPFALTDDFLDDAQKGIQWNAFVNLFDASEERPTLAEVGAVLRTILLPCISKESNSPPACNGVQPIIGIENDGGLTCFVLGL